MKIGRRATLKVALAGAIMGLYNVISGRSTGQKRDGSADAEEAPLSLKLEAEAAKTSVASVSTIEDLMAYGGASRTVIVADALRGGSFVRAPAATAGTADEIFRIRHSDPTYIWQRWIEGEYLTSWARVPHAGGNNYAPYLQRFFDGVPRGGVVRNNIASHPFPVWQVAPWSRQDGRKVCLVIRRSMTVQWGANQFQGYLAYDERLPPDWDVVHIESNVGSEVANNTMDYGHRWYDLSILPTTGAASGRHTLVLSPTATDNLADIRFYGGQIVATNPSGYAIYSQNTGQEGMLRLGIFDLKQRGGIRLEKLGDSCELVGGTHTGSTQHEAVFVSLLDPSNPMDAASMLVLREINISALAGAITIENAATFELSGCNVEVQGRQKGGAANFGRGAVRIVRCGTQPGVPGRSGHSYSGSRITGNKVFPASGGDYQTSSGAYAIEIVQSRGIVLEGGALGAAPLYTPDNDIAALGKAISIEASSDIIVGDGIDFNLSPDTVGCHIMYNSKNCHIGHNTNNIPPTRSQLVLDQGQGTTGVLRRLQPAEGYTDQVTVGYEALGVIKNRDGTVRLIGTLVPVTGQADIPLNSVVVTLPVGFAPSGIARRMVGVEHRGLDPAHPTYRRWVSNPACVLSAVEGGQVQINARTQETPQDTAPLLQATMVALDLSWYAPPVP